MLAVGTGLNIEDIGLATITAWAELVGLALRGTSDCPMELNLRPARVVRRHELAEKRPYLIVAGFCALLALAAWWQYFVQAAKVMGDGTQKLAPKIAELQKYEKLIDQAKKDIKAKEDTAQPYLAAVEEKTYWVQLIEDINSRLPRDFVWITNFDLQKNDSGPGGAAASRNRGATAGPRGTVLLLKGLYLWNTRQAQVVDDFKNKLKESPLFTVDEDPEHNIRKSSNDQEWAYEWTIPLILKNPPVAANER